MPAKFFSGDRGIPFGRHPDDVIGVFFPTVAPKGGNGVHQRTASRSFVMLPFGGGGLEPERIPTNGISLISS